MCCVRGLRLLLVITVSLWQQSRYSDSRQRHRCGRATANMCHCRAAGKHHVVVLQWRRSRFASSAPVKASQTAVSSASGETSFQVDSWSEWVKSVEATTQTPPGIEQKQLSFSNLRFYLVQSQSDVAEDPKHSSKNSNKELSSAANGSDVASLFGLLVFWAENQHEAATLNPVLAPRIGPILEIS